MACYELMRCSYAEEIRRQAAESLLEEMDATLSSPEKSLPRRRCASLTPRCSLGC